MLGDPTIQSSRQKAIREGNVAKATVKRKADAGWLLRTAFLTLAVVACGHSPTEPSRPASDSATIVSISPDPGTPLTAGSSVTFKGTVAYGLASVSSAVVVIVIEDQAFNNLSSTRPQPAVTVSRGTGTVTLSDSAVIPTTGVSTVLVFFPLAPPPGAGGTALAVQSVTYTVR